MPKAVVTLGLLVVVVLSIFVGCRFYFKHQVGRMDRLIEETAHMLAESTKQNKLSNDKMVALANNINIIRKNSVASLGALERYGRNSSRASSGQNVGCVLLRQRLGFRASDVFEYVIPELKKELCDREYLYALVASVPDESGGWLDARFSREFLFSQRQNLYGPFVKHLYSVYPRKGIIHLLDSCIVDEGRRAELVQAAGNVVANSQMELFLGGVVVSDGGVQSTLRDLSFLSQSKEWWIRYFVADFLRSSPVYREAALIAQLKADPNPLVREILDSVRADN